MFNVVVNGRLTKDIEVKQNENGNSYAITTLAHNMRVKGENKPVFLNLLIGNSDIIDRIGKMKARKGSAVEISGTMELMEEGGKRDDGSFQNPGFRIRVNTFDYAMSTGGGKKAEGNGNAAPANTAPAPADSVDLGDDGDLPF